MRELFLGLWMTASLVAMLVGLAYAGWSLIQLAS